MYLLTYFVVNREVGVSKQVLGTVVIDDEGNAVLVVKKPVAVQTARQGVVLGNVLNQQENPRRAIEQPSRPTPTIVQVENPTRAIEQPSRITTTIVQPSRDVGGGGYDDDDECCSCCSCCCALKWTLLTIFCLPCLPFICIYKCCKD